MDETCRQILTSLGTYLDGEIYGDVETVVAEHLADCPPCLDRADFERELKALLANRCREQAPSGLVDRVLDRLQSPEA